MINWGVIGAGGIAYRRTIPEGIAKSKNSKLLAITDINLDFARKISCEYELKLYNNEEDLINDKDIDAVYIATPVFLHHRQCILAAKKGKHIFCEKIMALNEKQCNEMIDVCKSHNVKLAIAYMMRFNSIHKKIREMVKNGILGKIVLGRAQLSCWYPPIEDAWRQKKDLGGGGSLADMGSHCIDLLEFIFNSKVKEVSCFTSNFVHDYQTEDTSIVTCKFEKEAFGIIDNCFNIPDSSSKNILEIYGTKGSILCRGTIGQDSNGQAEVYLERKEAAYNAGQKRLNPNKTANLEVKPINIYQAEIEYFADCIEKNIEPEISGELGLHHIKIVEACYKSAKEQKIIKIN
jgi:1,5-anhydro-D-fructose reductase (1,5-anhydro-D-mannitol-forming)